MVSAAAGADGVSAEEGKAPSLPQQLFLHGVQSGIHCAQMASASTKTPCAAVVHRIHDRYLLEVVEGLNLCPFARHSREQGRVHRPLFWIDEARPDPAVSAQTLATLLEEQPDTEIVLLTYLDNKRVFPTSRDFDAFVAEVRAAYGQLSGPVFFMVGFHLKLGQDIDKVTKDSLVPLIRRSPDPVIQCVSGAVLERVRAQAQVTAHKRMVESFADDPVMRAMIERSVQSDSELSAEIARNNFASVGEGDGRARLEGVLADIMVDRDASYAMRE